MHVFDQRNLIAIYRHSFFYDPSAVPAVIVSMELSNFQCHCCQLSCSAASYSMNIMQQLRRLSINVEHYWAHSPYGGPLVSVLACLTSSSHPFFLWSLFSLHFPGQVLCQTQLLFLHLNLRQETLLVPANAADRIKLVCMDGAREEKGGNRAGIKSSTATRCLETLLDHSTTTLATKDRLQCQLTKKKQTTGIVTKNCLASHTHHSSTTT